MLKSKSKRAGKRAVGKPLHGKISGMDFPTQPRLDRKEKNHTRYGAICGCAESGLLPASASDFSICCKSFFI